MKKHLITILTTFILTTGCDNDSIESISYDAGAILENIGTNVILTTYTDLDNKAATLLTAVETLQTTPNATHLGLARQAWRDARSPWEKSEGFLFGPVDTKGIDPSIDSWPVNKIDLDAVLAGDATLNKTYIDGLEGTLKGFHTIEYLLWDEDGNKLYSEFTTREYEYLIACVQSLKGATAELKNSWSSDGDNFVANISEAGSAASIYVSQKAALQELVDGLIGIADEVANGKINDPLSQQDLSLEESQFSDNSKADFQDNIRSILNVYQGSYTIDGLGIADFVQAQNAELHTRFLEEIEHAIADIGNIPGTFGEAVFNNAEDVEHAQEAVRTIQQTLEEDIAPLIAKLK